MNYLKLMLQKYILITSLFSFFLLSLNAQIRLDVEGDAKIRGTIDLIKADGDSSVFIGVNAGLNDDGSTNENTFIGTNSGKESINGNRNAFVGFNAGKSIVSGGTNTLFGHSAGSNGININSNTFIGFESGRDSQGSLNSFLGAGSGRDNTTGNSNTFLGTSAGLDNTTGSENVFIGRDAGRLVAKMTRTTFLGNNAGVASTLTIDSLDRAMAIGYNAKVDCHSCAVIGGTGADAVKVGIGTTEPTYTMEIQFDDGGPDTSPGNGLKLQNLGNNDHSWQLYVNNTTGDLELYNNETFKGAFDDLTGAYSGGVTVNKFVGNVEIINTSTDSSIYIGANAGINLPIANGLNNLFVGNNAGQANTNSVFSTILGYDAGKNGVGGLNNTLVGNIAGLNNSGNSNTFVGSNTGRDNSTGSSNVFLGSSAGLQNNGSFNTFLGLSAGFSNLIGDHNTFVGNRAGGNATNGSDNVMIGSLSGSNALLNTRNTIIGSNAGPLGTDSLDRAIAIGYNAQVDCHNCAVIGGTGIDAVKVGIGTATPIYDLDIHHATGAPTSTPGNGFNLKNTGGNNHSWQLFIGDGNGKLRLYKNESLRGTFDEVSGNYTPSSDRRLKNNIQTLANQLPLINRLRPTSYNFNGRKTDRKVYGLIAQEVQKIIPDIVLENEADNPEMKTLGISYTELIPVLIAGMQEQQIMIQEKDQVVEDLTEKLIQLENRLTKMEEKMANSSPTTTLPTTLPIEQITLNTPMLWQNSPNPFHEWTQIQYAIPDKFQEAIIQITNQQGQVVHTKSIATGGQGTVNIQIGNATQGNYFYSLILDGQIFETKQMILSK